MIVAFGLKLGMLEKMISIAHIYSIWFNKWNDQITSFLNDFDDALAYLLQFLSMKVSTVYPEANVEPEQILQRDVSTVQWCTKLKIGSAASSVYVSFSSSYLNSFLCRSVIHKVAVQLSYVIQERGLTRM